MSELMRNNDLTGYEVAVIGMACRFPGAASVDEFWENLKNGKECICFFSEEELVESGVSTGLLENPNFIKAKAMLEGVNYFDASFFNYTLREAGDMDPQLRILLESGWDALEDAGWNPDNYDGSIGFYVGAGTHLYWIARMLGRVNNPSEDFGALAVNDSSSFSTQVSYRLNLKGPAVSLQTACSTSLVAIHLACQALLSGECDMAMAGGVTVRLPVKSGYLYQEGMVMSSDGHCRAFDAAASGTVGGEGVGLVVLKPAENALRDRDHIYALVKGSAVNNDGNRRVGYSAPSVKGQTEVIRMARQAADVEADSITYIETHGTGTILGDPVELRALSQAFDTEKTQFCRIGSVKSNVGHLDAAAGVAGFIKAVLALYHRIIPPTLNFATPNPEIDFGSSPFIMNTELVEWINHEYPLRAGVSSFGIGGTNAHVVMEESPIIGNGAPSGPQTYRLILLSARTEAALERNTFNLVEYLKKDLVNPANPVNPGLPDVAYTLQVGRKPFEHRRMVVCRDESETIEMLSAGNSKKVRTHRLTTDQEPPVIFMFSGLGSQYVNMGYDLYKDEPVFREEMNRCFDILRSILDYDLKAVLYPGIAAEKDINQPDIVQLVIFVFEYALAKLLMTWGITPYAMIGYSFGEYTAACIAGVFSLEGALTLIVERGRLVEKTADGAMLSVPLPREELKPLLSGADNLSLAIDNGPSCIIAGPKGAVEAFEKELKQKKYLCMRLNASRGIHSPLMNPILEAFETRLRQMRLKEPQLRYISNVTGQWITAAEAVEPAYWSRHLAHAVKFADGIKELVKEPGAIFLELGPGRDLTAMVQRYLGENQRLVNLVRPPQKEISDTAYLLDRIGRLWIYGKEIDWQEIYESRGEKRYRVSLPTYSFEKHSFALEENRQPRQKKHEQEQVPAITSTYERTQLPDDFEAPRDIVEKKIAEAFQDIFGLDRIGIHEDFFELGGDSLKVITLVTRLHRELDIEVPMEAVFKHPTVKEIACYIAEEAGESIFYTIPPVEEKEFYPLSPSQKRVFIVEQIEEKGEVYNMPAVVWMEGELDFGRLETVCKALLERHESLRTGFFLVDGEPVQRVYKPREIEFEIEYHEGEVEVETIITDFIRSFDLSCPPLWRVGVVNVEVEKHILMNCIHHIVSDDISIGVLMMEFSALYRCETLEELPAQYKEYAVWQQQVAVVDAQLKKQKEYWLNLFADVPDLPVLEMPCDYPRPELQSFEGDHIDFVIDLEPANRLAALAGKNKTTLFVLLFTLYNVLLYKYTGQEDIIVGTPITGRSHRDVQQVVGMFVNTLALRNHPKGYMTVEEFLQEVKENTLDAFSNQFYQFEDLVEQLEIPRDISRNPLFDIMFVLHTVNLENVNIPGMRNMYPYEFEYSVSRFDITLNVAEFSGGLRGGVEYNTAIFKKDTMQRFMDHFLAVMESAARQPEAKLDDLQMLSQEELEQVVVDFNATEVDYPGDKTVQQLFEEQAVRTPDGVAVTGAELRVESFEHLQITYKVLNEKSNRLARRLRGLGVTSESIVGIMTDRTVEMIFALLAVLKSGAAYLPIDPFYPVERVRYMVQHTGAPVILTTPFENEIPLDLEPLSDTQMINLVKEAANNNTLESENLPPFSGPADLAYIIYTSGTTGVPKGVMIENRSVVNFIKGITDHIPFTNRDAILSLTTIAFDIFGLETLLPLTKGVKVVIGGVEEQANSLAAAAVVAREKVTIFQLTPSRLQLFISDPDAAKSLGWLKYLVIGGEVFPAPLLEKARVFTRGKIYNVYGPTETTIWSTIKDVTGDNPLNIGKPIANTRIYILSRGGGVQPVGIPGELCIAGDGVARGYFKDKTLTSEKFITESRFLVTDKFQFQESFNEKLLRGVQGDSFLEKSPPGHRRLYKTGDLARWLPCGNIEIFGRMDQQIKVRGFRIEPGEIESLLLKHGTVKETVVLAENDDKGEKFLCAYIVSGSDPSVSELREFLGRELPDYMIPSSFIKIDKIPVTPNGKIDRKAFSKAEGAQLKLGSVYVAPETGIEKAIVDTWKEVLQLDQVGVEDNFFDLGGTSLKVIMTMSKLKVLLEREIPVVAMFRYPTVRSMAHFLSREDSVFKKRDRTEVKKKGRERLNQKRHIKSRVQETAG
jgi:amino acid adenylation domain-containing protein